MIELRYYQNDAIEAAMDYWREGGGNPLIDLATGTGKSVVIGKMIQDLLTQYPDMRVLMLTHVKELVQQNFMALKRVWPDSHAGIYSAGLNRRDVHHRITFASIQSVFKKASALGRRDLVCIDEAHLVPMSGVGMYRRLLDDLHAIQPDARVQAILAGGQEQSRLAGLSRDQATFGNNANQQMWNNQFQATQGNNGLAGQQFADQQTMFNAQNAQRNQWLQEQYQQRNQPINEISALLSGAQVTGPNFVNSANSQIATTDVAGIINQDYQNRLGAWQQQQAQTGGILGGLFGLGGKLIGLSDVRSKENIRRVGVLDNGLPVYAYNYKGDGMTHIGLIAQEVEQVNPEAVSRIGDVRIVDYGKAVEAA